MNNITPVHSQDELHARLLAITGAYPQDQVFLLCDSNSHRHCLPLLRRGKLEALLPETHVICLPAGDQNKNIDSLSLIWQTLSRNGATRHALLLNLGGGMITDIGGFAAATFKRGIGFVNLPTTLLACVDAAQGGKTGINFNGLKNEVGAFCPAREVLVYPAFFQTLDKSDLACGYAEMLKHGLLSTPGHWQEVIRLELADVCQAGFSGILMRSMQVKADIVAQDPTENGLRKCLNLGHTVGHAFESWSHEQQQPVPHGYAVAWGLICELYLSMRLLGFPKEPFQQTIYRIKEVFGALPFSCKNYPSLIEKMHHDKKNSGDKIQFALLSDIGQIHIDQVVDEKTIEESLDFYLDFMGY